MKPRFELGTILREYHSYIETGPFNAWQRRTLFALSRCRTAAMGGHIDQCEAPGCSKLHLSYNSCRNRHCPKCQGHRRELWIQKREAELLPVGYYHVVFTLPRELNELALSNPILVYNTLFKAAWATLNGFARNPNFLGATTGMISILHTWGSNMSLHPHLHCIVPSGGTTKDGKWKNAPRADDFLFPVQEMSKVFRAKHVAELRKKGIKGKVLFDRLFTKKWVVYAKKPFGNTNSVIEYLGRYTHKIAISNHRIKAVENGRVIFQVKNYKKDGKPTLLTLQTEEFIRRFSMHILPKGFVRVRHFGLLSSTSKRLHLGRLLQQLGTPEFKIKVVPLQHLVCPNCKKGKLKTVCQFDNRGPPKHWLERLKNQNTYAKKNKAIA